MGILQHGNGLLGFNFKRTDEVDNIVNTWWENEYALFGEEFNVEVFFDTNTVHVMFFTDLPFYKQTNKAKVKLESLQDDPSKCVDVYLKSLPFSLHDLVQDVTIGDWDYIELVKEEK